MTKKFFYLSALFGIIITTFKLVVFFLFRQPFGYYMKTPSEMEDER